jgi:cytochrome c oxidase subunit 1
MHLNVFMSVCAWCLGLAQIPFIFNFFWSIWKGEKVSDNYWDATTLEWAAASSPPMAHGNFATPPEVFRGAYEYSPPGNGSDFLPQNKPVEAR